MAYDGGVASTEGIAMADDNFDPLEIPNFLIRLSDHKRRFPVRGMIRRHKFKQSPEMKAILAKSKEAARKRLGRLVARAPVLAAVIDGADTFGKIRKATGLDPTFIHAALRFHRRRIVLTGKRYTVRSE
jgi:hypothetical protein